MPRCENCVSTTINGVFCHEAGCLDAWKDSPIPCRVCGQKFQPKIAYVDVCSDCEEEWNAAGD